MKYVYIKYTTILASFHRYTQHKNGFYWSLELHFFFWVNYIP